METDPSPAEFIDFEAKQSRWLLPLIGISVAFAIGAGIIIAFAFSRSFLPTAAPVVFVVLLVAFLIAYRVTLPDRLAARVKAVPEASFTEVLDILFSSAWRFPGQNLRKAMACLATQGRRNMVARVCRTAKKQVIRPLHEVFEPMPVDESIPLFMAMERDDDTGTPEEDLVASAMDRRESMRRLKRNVALAGGFGMVLLFGINAIMAAIESWQTKRIHPNLIMWTAWLAVAFFGLGGRGAYSWKQQWMLVPGGIVSRRSRMFRSATELHLFKRTESVLIAQAAQQKLWAVHVADAGASQMARMTAREAHLLLRAWLSPIPPPPIEQLSDLQ